MTAQQWTNTVYVEDCGGEGSEGNNQSTTGMEVNSFFQSGSQSCGRENEGLDIREEEEETENVDENVPTKGESSETDGKFKAPDADIISEDQIQNAVARVTVAENTEVLVAEQSHNIYIVDEYKAETSEKEKSACDEINGEGETSSSGSSSSRSSEQSEDVSLSPPPSYTSAINPGANMEPGNSQYIIETDLDGNLPHPTPPPAPVPADEWYTVDREMLVCKLSYFFDQAKEASIWPYLVLFQVSVGLGTFQAGIINGLRFIGCLIGGPLWGMIADQKRIHRPLIVMITMFAILFQCSQPFWAELLGPEDKNCCPSRSNETIKDAEKKQASGNAHNSNMFYTLLIISIAACFFDGTTLSFVDSGVQRKIKAVKRPINFGRQRMFGSLGYAFGSVVSSAAVTYFPHAEVSCFAGMFCVYFVIGICLLMSFSNLYKGANATTETNKPTRSSPDPKVNQIIWNTMKSFHVVFFLATVLFNGLMRALVFSFTYLYLKELGAGTMLLGISMVVSQAASLVFYALAERIIDLVGCTMRVMALSCFSWVIRLLCLAYMENYYLILPINILNGISASLFVASSIIHVRRTCPPVAYTTMYGIRNALFNGGGYIIANVVGGELYQMHGAKTLFLYTCLICAVWVCIMIAYLVKYRNTQTEVAVEMNEIQSEGEMKGRPRLELRPPSYRVAPLPNELSMTT